MATIGYSPWADAGRMGQGLADTLGQILLTVPQVRAQRQQQQYQNERQQRQDAQEARLRPLNEDYLRSQIARNMALGKEDEARAGYYAALPGIQEHKAAQDTRFNKLSAMYHEAALKAKYQTDLNTARKAGSANRYSMVYGNNHNPVGTLNTRTGKYDDLPPVPEAPSQPITPTQSGGEREAKGLDRILLGWSRILGQGNLQVKPPGGGLPPNMLPTQGQMAPQQTGPRQINSQQEYDALPIGSPYLDSRGLPHVKR